MEFLLLGLEPGEGVSHRGLPPEVSLSDGLSGDLGLGSLGYFRERHYDYLTKGT